MSWSKVGKNGKTTPCPSGKYKLKINQEEKDKNASDIYDEYFEQQQVSPAQNAIDMIMQSDHVLENMCELLTLAFDKMDETKRNTLIQNGNDFINKLN